MITRHFHAVGVSAAALTVALFMVVGATDAAPLPPPLPGPGPVGTGSESCLTTPYGDVCTVNIILNGPTCVVTAAGAMQCSIPSIGQSPYVTKIPSQRCYRFTSPSGTLFGICDVIPDSLTRCVVSIKGQIQCNREVSTP